MALEEQVVNWAATRPAWQRYLLRRAARGEVLTEAHLDEFVAQILETTFVADDHLALEDLPQTAEGDDPVRLVSISEPEHVNALASDQPLTFEIEGLTIVYGDNGTGKSGYARLLKAHNAVSPPGGRSVRRLPRHEPCRAQRASHSTGRRARANLAPA